ncbi:MAG: ABC transporter permease [Actinobacteria bacterium]|nr:ABC transporter permease [Actinomycetota bacterium]MBV8395441.1 ABC transporter permease [Actinomycetota bacterium]
MTAIPLNPSEAVKPAVAAKTPGQLFWARFKDDKGALFAAVVVVLLIFIAVAGGPISQSITHHSNTTAYTEQTTGICGTPMEDSFGLPKGPNGCFWFGADGAGRDLFVRTMYGVRTSLIVGVIASAIAVIVGLLVGMTAGFFGGWVDTLLSRIADVMLAIPYLLIAIGITAACNTTVQGCLGGLIKPGIGIVIGVIAFFSWSYIARIVRGFTLSVKERDFVEAARSLGASNARIIFREVLPNLIGPIIVYTTLLIPANILFEAGLSFLGLGVPPDTASLGGLLNEATQYYDVTWWLTFFPGLFLILITLAFNLLGDGLRDALDVRTDR